PRRDSRTLSRPAGARAVAGLHFHRPSADRRPGGNQIIDLTRRDKEERREAFDPGAILDLDGRAGEAGLQRLAGGGGNLSRQFGSKSGGDGIGREDAVGIVASGGDRDDEVAGSLSESAMRN